MGSVSLHAFRICHTDEGSQERTPVQKAPVDMLANNRTVQRVCRVLPTFGLHHMSSMERCYLQFTPDVFSFRLCFGAAAELLQFQSVCVFTLTECVVCLQSITALAIRSAPETICRNLFDAACTTEQFSTEQMGCWTEKQNKASGLISKFKKEKKKLFCQLIIFHCCVDSNSDT